MESHHFDRIAKHISRRGVTKGLLAGGAAGLFALLGRQSSQAQGCAAACRDGECADLRGQAKGDCIRACTERCSCPPGYTYCPDDDTCYDLQTNDCHCADARVSGGNPCGGVCAGSGFGRCCVNGTCTQGSPDACPFECDPGIPRG